MKNIKLWLAGALLALAVVPSSHAGYFREQNGSLTTDLPGVSIAPSGIANVEAWDVSIDNSFWSVEAFPLTVPEPEGEPGLINSITLLVGTDSPVVMVPLFRWTSDVPALRNTFEVASLTFDWTTVAGAQVEVTFEDLGDAVPDSSSTAGLLLISCATLAFAARTRVASALL